ncbi:hypothetical protein CARUB_v10018694mg [Capsella rubella]|uniref:SKP1-like protein n=1 Tax=Capsella rubella TaxID=81985 RepID=R0FMF7_9BRAS|nr:SKP1-like protein 14 [Capsella rubella]EOA23196.1 hypothetical protein CARUB_v10018694mg [Capsella rubella]
MSSNKIVLTCSDGESFEVEEVVARKLKIVEQMIDKDCPDKAITLENVTVKILGLVIVYCKRHADEPRPGRRVAAEKAEKMLEDWDKEFMKSLDVDTILQLMEAASDLNVNGGSLLDLTCKSIADSMKDKSVEEMRKLFNIVNDYTPEEEEAIRKEQAWAFETLNRNRRS